MRCGGSFKDMEEAWGKEIRSEPEAYFDLGDHTLGFAVLRGSGRQSGSEVTMPIAGHHERSA
jgi:hypothetical protein